MQRAVYLYRGLVLALTVGCGDDSPGIADAAIASQDAGRALDGGGAEVAPACACQVSGRSATLSYDCYCAGAKKPPSCGKKLDTELAWAKDPQNIACTTVVEYEGCGLTAFPWRYGFALGDSVELYDTTSGAWVGSLLVNDTNVSCPADSSAAIPAFSLRIGRSLEGCSATRCTKFCRGTATACTAN